MGIMKDKLTSRKFIFALLVIILNCVLVYLGKISDGVYSTVMLATVAAYLAAHVIQTKAVVEAETGTEIK
jgi:hypothetical protein